MEEERPWRERAALRGTRASFVTTGSILRQNSPMAQGTPVVQGSRVVLQKAKEQPQTEAVRKKLAFLLDHPNGRAWMVRSLQADAKGRLVPSNTTWQVVVLKSRSQHARPLLHPRHGWQETDTPCSDICRRGCGRWPCLKTVLCFPCAGAAALGGCALLVLTGADAPAEAAEGCLPCCTCEGCGCHCCSLCDCCCCSCLFDPGVAGEVAFETPGADAASTGAAEANSFAADGAAEATSFAADGTAGSAASLAADGAAGSVVSGELDRQWFEIDGWDCVLAESIAASPALVAPVPTVMSDRTLL